METRPARVYSRTHSLVYLPLECVVGRSVRPRHSALAIAPKERFTRDFLRQPSTGTKLLESM